MNQYSAYFKAFKTNIKDGYNINPPPENIHFRYTNVSFRDFTEHYSGNGWLGRKLYAIPLALWSGVIKTIYRLVKAIFVGIFKAFSDKGQYLKAQFFYICRDFQEAFGRVTSIFNDRYGLYHIQDSQFHNKAYSLFFDKQLNRFFNRFSPSSGGDSSSSTFPQSHNTSSSRWSYENIRPERFWNNAQSWGYTHIPPRNSWSRSNIHEPAAPPTQQLDKHYAVLGIDRNANEREIKVAFNKLAKDTHTDRQKKLPTESDEQYKKRVQECNKRFNEVKKAYDAIKKAKEGIK